LLNIIKNLFLSQKRFLISRNVTVFTATYGVYSA